MKSDWRRFDLSFAGGVMFAVGRSGGEAVPLMHGKCPFAKQYVEHVHRTVLGHGGGHATLVTACRKTVHMSRAYALAKQVIRGCFHCKRANPWPVKQKMAPLPQIRLPAVDDSRGPFKHIATDCFGPIEVITPGRGNPRGERFGIFYIFRDEGS